MAGDIVCNDPTFPFHIECKWQEIWNPHQIWEHTGPVVDAWWFQAKQDCPDSRIPVLIATRNHIPIFVVGESSDFELWLRKDCHNYMRMYEYFEEGYGDHNLVMFLLESLLSSSPKIWAVDC